jgi:hypothetical protein
MRMASVGTWRKTIQIYLGDQGNLLAIKKPWGFVVSSGPRKKIANKKKFCESCSGVSRLEVEVNPQI